MSADIYVATESAVLFVGGQQYVVHKGRTRVRAGHPLLARNAHLFGPLGVDYDIEQTAESAPVEQATAAPGEKRELSKPDPAVVRAWAADNSIDVPARGKLPASVIADYLAAHQG
jgi:hypothetical protein